MFLKFYRIVGISLVTVCMWAFTPFVSFAEISGSQTKNDHLVATLIAEPQSIAAGKTFTVGLKLTLEPHWHVYWINPGDAGLPVSMQWDLPKGLSAQQIQWPYPERIAVPPLMNFGYENEVLFPVNITADKNMPVGSPVTLKAKAKWIVCKEICLPGSAELTLTLNTTKGDSETSKPPEMNPQTQVEFAKARSRLPLLHSSWNFAAQLDDSIITLIITNPEGATLPNLGSIHFFPLTPDLIENAPPQKLFSIKTNKNGYALELKKVPPDPEAIADSNKNRLDSLIGVVVASQGWSELANESAPTALDAKLTRKAIQIRVPILTRQKPIQKRSSIPNEDYRQQSVQLGVGPNIGPQGSSLEILNTNEPDEKSALVKLLGMMFFAFLGGLILNLMPCVLPVLSLKIFDFVKRAGESRWKIFSHGLTFTAGVLVSFWILAGLLLILRSGGQQLGWGFQMQSPAFIIVLCALFFFFSLNLFGVFELGYMFTRIGGTGTQSGHAGSFFAGITATVVATPCTAPFMGSAMGYAFSQPPYYAMFVFTFLGLGMAAPYLILSGFPGLMRFLPKPGAWMEHLKQFMGFPLLATAIWLAWVLGHQAGVDALVALLSILLLAGLSAWILGKWTALHHHISIRLVAGILALVIFLPAFILVLVYLDQIRSVIPKPANQHGMEKLSNDGTGLANSRNEINYEPFSEERLTALLKDGKPVFINFTADWCLSCKVNERVAFGSQAVIQKFNELNITVLKADWTSRDEAITKALAKYGRSSIPFYVLYSGKDEHEFEILPEVLSPGIVLQSLKKIKVPPPSSPTTL